jgi:hypothetical protein
LNYLRESYGGLGFIIVAMVLTSMFPEVYSLMTASPQAIENYSNVQASTNVGEVAPIVLPVKIFKNLQGVRIDRLLVSSCLDTSIISLPKLVPRSFSRTLLASANATVIIPDVGDGILTEDDFIIISIPISSVVGSINTSTLFWNVLAAKYGLRERYIAIIPQGVRVLTDKGIQSLQTDLCLGIYYDQDSKRQPPIRETPYDTSILEKIGEALGLKTPATPKFFSNFSSNEAILAENTWNKWLSSIRGKLKSLDLGKGVIAKYDRREAFIYDPSGDRLIAEIKEKTVYKEKSKYEPAYYLINGGGGGPTAFYQFNLRLLNKTQVMDSITKNLYLGFNIYSATIYIYANSSSSSLQAKLNITVKVIDTDSGSTTWSGSYSYSLGDTPTSIYISPSIPYSSSKRYNISITYSYAGGSYPYVVISTLDLEKVWNTMPTNQTTTAYQILSVGIANIRDYNEPAELPPYCQRAKASDMLDPKLYGTYGSVASQGLILESPATSITMDSNTMNGLFVDSINKLSPVLYLDICILNKNQAPEKIKITVKVDGVTYAEQTVEAPLRPYFGYAGFTIYLDTNNIRGYGHMVTIEHNSTSWNMYFFIDALIEFKYSPEVWREDSYFTWVHIRIPWLKLNLAQGKGSGYVYKSSIVVDTKVFWSLGDYYILLKHLISSVYDANGNAPRIYGASVAIKPLSEPSNFGCNLKRTTGTKYDQYIGAVVSLWGFISTGIEVYSWFSGLSIEVSAGVFVADRLVELLQGLKESLNVERTSDGYYVCSWSPGINDYKEGELELFITYPSQPENNTFYVLLDDNEGWRLRPVKVTIPVYSYDDVMNSIDERFVGYYGRVDVYYG